MKREGLNEQIRDILLKHQGASNAITAKEICDRCGVPHCDGSAYIRAKILEVIKIYNLPVVAGGTGYYIIANENEYLEYIKRLEGRINEIIKRKSLVMRNYAMRS